MNKLLTIAFGLLALTLTSFLMKPNQSDLEALYVIYAPRIEFSYEVDSIPIEDNVYKVNAELTNTSLDTIHFHSTTCEGELDLLRYDTSQLQLTLQMNCNATNPRLITLRPGESYTFSALFTMKEFKSDFPMGFNYMRSWDGKKLESLEDFYKLKESNSPRNYLWAR